MNYSVKYKKAALKKLNSLDGSIRERIKTWIEKNLDGCENPRQHGKALHGEWYGYWRYRVDGYRIIAQINDDKVLVIVVKIDKREDIYG